jgi:hypothetical protein
MNRRRDKRSPRMKRAVRALRSRRPEQASRGRSGALRSWWRSARGPPWVR